MYYRSITRPSLITSVGHRNYEKGEGQPELGVGGMPPEAEKRRIVATESQDKFTCEMILIVSLTIAWAAASAPFSPEYAMHCPTRCHTRARMRRFITGTGNSHGVVDQQAVIARVCVSACTVSKDSDPL